MPTSWFVADKLRCARAKIARRLLWPLRSSFLSIWLFRELEYGRFMFMHVCDLTRWEYGNTFFFWYWVFFSSDNSEVLEPIIFLSFLLEVFFLAISSYSRLKSAPLCISMNEDLKFRTISSMHLLRPIQASLFIFPHPAV